MTASPAVDGVTEARTVTVAYAGGGARRGPVTMGQTNMIRCILRDEPASINIHDVWPVPDGTGMDRALGALAELAVRHEALRTTFPHEAGDDSSRLAVPAEQVVAAAGEFTVTVLDHDELPEDTDAYAEAVARAARDTRFRLDLDFPLRLRILARAGRPVRVALAASHAVADGSALGVLRDDWLALLAGEPLPPVTALTPLDLAAEERSPAGRRKSAACLAHWERILRTGPQAMFAEDGATGAETDTPGLTLRSARGARALAAAARRTGALPGTVLLTAWCLLTAHRAGQSVCVAAVPTANRFQPKLARSVSTLSQDALLALDVRAPSFDALLAKAWGAAMNAYRHSRFDALDLWELIGRVTTERGSRFTRDAVFNDISALPSTLAGAAAPDGDAPELELAWGDGQSLPTRLLTFVYETEPVLRLATWADPALFPRAAAEELVTGLVRLLEAVAEADVPLDTPGPLTEVTGVRPVTRGPEWTRVDGCWVSPAAVAAALTEALRGRPVEVVVERDEEGEEGAGAAGGSGRRLVAYIVADERAWPEEEWTPRRAHAALMDVLPGRPGVLAPHRYVFVEGPPRQPAAARRILREGTGREPGDANDHG
ncbi:condensation protein [Streptomyces sp. R302]|uniref:condensation domain-containing protein n=1 Tax=unclassified Streptomyces TaxID=2593676 RepID=UPI00145F570A|nr:MULTISPECIES: condensation domain-containing protein [unclassified Streptomyces]NML50665.1 condensation protein [Streptomyces sp. R301]NML80760.1 condensation protein [Streptomyces sp. R302]